MKQVYYFAQPASLYKGLRILSFLLGCFLFFCFIMSYLQDSRTMTDVQYFQKYQFFLYFNGGLIALCFWCTWYLKRFMYGKYRIDDIGLQYKDRHSHSVIKWSEIESLEFDGYGTMLFSGHSKRFMFSLLSLTYYQNIENEHTTVDPSISQSFNAVAQYIGITQQQEMPLYVAKAIDLFGEKLDLLQIEPKYNVYCGFKPNKNVKAISEIF